MVSPTAPEDRSAGPAEAASAAPSVDPLHGRTLEAIITALVEHYGWEELGRQIQIRCFTSDPSVGSSLRFLRKTPWAREKVESLYLFMLRDQRLDEFLAAHQEAGGSSMPAGFMRNATFEEPLR